MRNIKLTLLCTVMLVYSSSVDLFGNISPTSTQASDTGIINIRNFGAVGDGITDDTDAIRRAIMESGGMILIPRGRFRIIETIEIPLSETGPISLGGSAGTGTVIMEGAGPAFRFVGTHHGTAHPPSVEENVWHRERMPQVENLEIVGAHPEADGLEFIYTMQAIVRGALIRDVRHGIILSDRNRNFILDSSHIYKCSGSGLHLDRVSLHQINVTGNHISYCGKGAIRVVGGDIRNLQITGNDIEYNYDLKSDQSADIWIDVREGSVREGTISSNTIQASRSNGGANIRIVGAPDIPDKAGLWSITGNHISSQMVNIHIINGRGIVISGNSFLRGFDRAVLVENSRNIILGTNSIDNNPDYGEEAGNGITIKGSRGVLLSGIQLEFAGAVEGRHGAVEILESSDVSISNCNIYYPVPTGIYVEDSQNIQINQCMIHKARDRDGMTASIKVTGSSEKVFIRNNLTTSGTEGEIITKPGTSLLEGNHSID